MAREGIVEAAAFCASGWPAHAQERRWMLAKAGRQRASGERAGLARVELREATWLRAALRPARPRGRWAG